MYLLQFFVSGTPINPRYNGAPSTAFSSFLKRKKDNFQSLLENKFSIFTVTPRNTGNTRSYDVLTDNRAISASLIGARGEKKVSREIW